MSGATGNLPGGLDSGLLARPRWTDKSWPFTPSQINPVTSKPDFDFVRLGLLFPQNDTAEKVYILDQMDHRKIIGSAINPHVHFIQETADLPTFKLEYKRYNNGDDEPVAFTTLSTTGVPLFVWSGNPMMQIIQFPVVPAPVAEAVSSHFDMIFYRDDNLVPGDVLVKYFDYHYQMDDDGSREEFSK